MFFSRQTLSRILILKNTSTLVENKIPLIHLSNKKSLFGDSRFDLNGAKLQSTSAAYYPWIMMENCVENGSCSKVTGFTVDVVRK
jgi:hypothetical protein